MECYYLLKKLIKEAKKLTIWHGKSCGCIDRWCIDLRIVPCCWTAHFAQFGLLRLRRFPAMFKEGWWNCHGFAFKDVWTYLSWNLRQCEQLCNLVFSDWGGHHKTIFLDQLGHWMMVVAGRGRRWCGVEMRGEVRLLAEANNFFGSKIECNGGRNT